MKKVILVFLIIIPLWLMAQDMPFTVKSETRYGASGMVGSVKVDSIKYTQIRLIPEFEIWKFRIGLDLDFLLDKDKHLRKSDWNKLSVIPNKFYYIKFADRGDPFYAHLGGFPDHTLGNGLIMLNYSNMLLYPELRNTGLMLGGNPHWPAKPSIEAFSSNLEKNQILSFSAHFQPLPDSTVRILDKTVIGFSVVTDRNQYGNLKYVVNDSLNNLFKKKKNAAAVYSFDYTLPVLTKDKITFGHYAEVAHIANYGTGFIFPGLYAESKILKVNLEFRRYGSKFTPAFFDHLYEEQRPSIVDSIIFTKEQTLDGIPASYGWYGRVQTNISGKIKAMVAWQDMYGKNLKTGKSLWIRFWADTQYHRLENVSFSYTKTNVEHLALGKIIVPSAEIGAKLTFRISKKRWFLIGQYSESYNDRNGDNKINFTNETRRSVAAGVKYTF